jgi:hypothetical protein
MRKRTATAATAATSTTSTTTTISSICRIPEKIQFVAKTTLHLKLQI